MKIRILASEELKVCMRHVGLQLLFGASDIIHEIGLSMKFAECVYVRIRIQLHVRD